MTEPPIRPSFPDGFRHEVHVVVTVLSVDNENPNDILAVNAASAALAVSDIPFEGPVGCVRLCHIDGEWVANPTYAEQEDATIELVVAGRLNPAGEVDIMMIEAGGSERLVELVADGAVPPDEELLADAIERSKSFIAEAISLQQELIARGGNPKGTTGGEGSDYPLFVDYGDEVFERVKATVGDRVQEAISITVKKDRRAALEAIETDLLGGLGPDDEGQEGQFKAALRSLTKKLVRRRILEENVRLDGRRVDEVRPIWIQAGLVPRVHGSAVFTRGETQALTITTLGMQRMEQMIDDLSPFERKRYMHHYNFPPYSTGEAGFMRGPKRREIGHGALSEKALLPAIPLKDEFPYAIRVVSEILSSNGSTSMASVCASTLCLMDAGVPIKAPVSGIAMGLIAEDGKFVTLTDILGAEDAL